MDAKEEFYRNISDKFNQDQTKAIIQICDSIEVNLTSKESRESFYLHASSLYYNTARDYANFITNLKTSLPLTKEMCFFYEEHQQQENYEKNIYDDCRSLIDDFWTTNMVSLPANVDPKHLSYAIINAIIPELIEWIDIDERIREAEDREKLAALDKALKKGTTIDAIWFQLSNIENFKLQSKLFNATFWTDFYTYSYHYLYSKSGINCDKRDLDSIKGHIDKRLVIKTSMVFVKYGILKAAKKDNSYLLRTSNGKCVEIKNTVCLGIYELLKKLSGHTVFGQQKSPAYDGFIKLKKASSNKINATYIQNSLPEEKYSAIKKRLKSSVATQKEVFTPSYLNFSYSDISIMPYYGLNPINNRV